MSSPDLDRRSPRRRGCRSRSAPLKSRGATPLSTWPSWPSPLSAAHHFFCLSRICRGGCGEFGFETVVGGVFNLPGSTFRGGSDGLGFDLPMDCGFLPEYQYLSHCARHFFHFSPAMLLLLSQKILHFVRPDSHTLSQFAIARASVNKPNETRNANDKATSERTAGNLVLIIKLHPWLSR
jgi:hypothetical protein